MFVFPLKEGVLSFNSDFDLGCSAKTEVNIFQGLGGWINIYIYISCEVLQKKMHTFFVLIVEVRIKKLGCNRLEWGIFLTKQ